MIKPIIMAGGSGTRLWPLSRSAHPKQFLALNSGADSMLQATVKRLDGLVTDSSITICNEEHRFFVAEQLREIDRLGIFWSRWVRIPRLPLRSRPFRLWMMTHCCWFWRPTM